MGKKAGYGGQARGPRVAPQRRLIGCKGKRDVQHGESGQLSDHEIKPNTTTKGLQGEASLSTAGLGQPSVACLQGGPSLVRGDEDSAGVPNTA